MDARNEMPDTPPVIAVARDVWNRFYQTEAAGLFEDDGYSGPPVHITVPAPLVTNPKFSSRPSGQGEENEEDDDDGDDDEVSEHLLRVAAAKDGFDAPITSSLNDALRNGIRFLTWDPSEPRLVRAAALTLEKIVDRLNHESECARPSAGCKLMHRLVALAPGPRCRGRRVRQDHNRIRAGQTMAR